MTYGRCLLPSRGELCCSAATYRGCHRIVSFDLRDDFWSSPHKQSGEQHHQEPIYQGLLVRIWETMEWSLSYEAEELVRSNKTFIKRKLNYLTGCKHWAKYVFFSVNMITTFMLLTDPSLPVDVQQHLSLQDKCPYSFCHHLLIPVVEVLWESKINTFRKKQQENKHYHTLAVQNAALDLSYCGRKRAERMAACKADISGRIMVGGVEHVQSSNLVKVSLNRKRQRAGSPNKLPKMSGCKKKSVINIQLISV